VRVIRLPDRPQRKGPLGAERKISILKWNEAANVAVRYLRVHESSIHRALGAAADRAI
jgi:hypothetical protein